MPAHFHFRWQNLWPLWREIWLFAVFVISALWTAYRRWASFSWPEVEGTVEDYRSVPAERKSSSNNGIVFSYRVDGEFFSGEMIAVNRWSFPKNEEQMRRLYPKGSKIRVRYKSGKPSEPVALPAEVPHRSVYFPPRDEPRPF